MTAPTPQQILAVPMDGNDADADTIHDYLTTLLLTVWDEQDGFSGKRPFGNSGWAWDLYLPLVKAGFVSGEFYEDGDIKTATVDKKAAHALIYRAIQAMGPTEGDFS